MVGAGLVLCCLERAEQEIQTTGAIGADFGQLARRFRQLLLLPGWRDDPWIVLGGRHGGRRNHRPSEDRNPAVPCTRESKSHAGSLDVENRAAKQRVVKDL